MVNLMQFCQLMDDFSRKVDVIVIVQREALGVKRPAVTAERGSFSHLRRHQLTGLNINAAATLPLEGMDEPSAV